MLRNLTIAGLASVGLAGMVLALAAFARPRVQPSETGSRARAGEARLSGQGSPNSAQLRTAGRAPSPEADAQPVQAGPARWLRAEAGRERPSSEAGLALFREQIRPLLAAKCLTCHEPERREGGLDLSRRSAALAGGDSGEAIVPGQPRQSLVYQLVTAAEMPPEMKDLLSPAEITALAQWIELGAPYELGPLTADAQESIGESAIAWGPTSRNTNPLGGSTLPLSKPLTKDQAGLRAEYYLKSLGNPHLKVGRVDETAVSFEVQVVTKENSLANWIIVDKKTGRMRLLYQN